MRGTTTLLTHLTHKICPTTAINQIKGLNVLTFIKLKPFCCFVVVATTTLTLSMPISMHKVVSAQIKYSVCKSAVLRTAIH